MATDTTKRINKIIADLSRLQQKGVISKTEAEKEIAFLNNMLKTIIETKQDTKQDTKTKNKRVMNITKKAFDVEKILSYGTAKEKIKLLAEDHARYRFNRPGLLTMEQRLFLYDNFKSKSEIKIYNDWIRLDDLISECILNLHSALQQTLIHISNIRGYILVWNTIEEAELLVNSVLYEIKDIDDRKRIANLGLKGVDILLTKTEVDNTGYIKLDIKNKLKATQPAFLEIMDNVKRECEEAFIKYLSLRKAILDYMKQKKFNIQTYQDIIKAFTDELYKPISPYEKYAPREPLFQVKYNSKRLQKLKKEYSIAPDFLRQEIDEKIYNDYRKNRLDLK